MNLPTPPILFIIFNRPDLTSRVFERIREQRPSQLFIAADGPRASKPDDFNRCYETREVTRNIDWPCEVHRLERDVNIGCKIGVSSAISWFFEHVEQGIILEDDCLADASFFPYCSELLERFKNVNQVALISGNNFQKVPCSQSYYFTRHPLIWGWASWRRTWKLYDIEMKTWNGDPNSLRQSISNACVRRHFARRFNGVKFEGANTWAYPLTYCCFANHQICINPSRNLVENIGFDERATHTNSSSELKNMRQTSVAMKFPLHHPSSTSVDESADFYYETKVREIAPHFFAKLLRSIEKRTTTLKSIIRVLTKKCDN